jgi:hypothetical protein
MTVYDIVFIVGSISVLLFAGVVVFGAPFLPTLSKRVDDAIELLDLKPGQTFIELGSGDSRLQIAAAKKGIKSIGYELNPLLVIYAKAKSFRYRKLVTVKLANYWLIDWPEHDAIYAFLLNPFMQKLHTRIVQRQSKKPLTLVSFAFKIPNKEPTRNINGMLQYKYK